MLARTCMVIAVVLFACGGGSKKMIDAAAGSDAGADDAAHSDATPGDAAAVGPACGTKTCTNGTQDCCIGTTSACKPTGTCPSQGFACDGPEDCAGALCCFGNGGQGGSSCKATCATIACHSDVDCPVATPICCPKTFTPGYSICSTTC